MTALAHIVAAATVPGWAWPAAGWGLVVLLILAVARGAAIASGGGR